jgi:hypothetical protein
VHERGQVQSRCLCSTIEAELLNWLAPVVWLGAKVLSGTLLRSVENPTHWVLDIIEDMLSVAVHLYEIPNVDFLVHW